MENYITLLACVLGLIVIWNVRNISVALLCKYLEIGTIYLLGSGTGRFFEPWKCLKTPFGKFYLSGIPVIFELVTFDQLRPWALRASLKLIRVIAAGLVTYLASTILLDKGPSIYEFLSILRAAVSLAFRIPIPAAVLPGVSEFPDIFLIALIIVYPFTAILDLLDVVGMTLKMALTRNE